MFAAEGSSITKLIIIDADGFVLEGLLVIYGEARMGREGEEVPGKTKGGVAISLVCCPETPSANG